MSRPVWVYSNYSFDTHLDLGICRSTIALPLQRVTTPQMNDAENRPAVDVNSLDELEKRLTRTLGTVVGGAALSRALGYPSQGAFRQAVARGRLPVRVFELEGRRGRFALTADIARWLWAQCAPQKIESVGKGIRKTTGGHSLRTGTVPRR